MSRWTCALALLTLLASACSESSAVDGGSGSTGTSGSIDAGHDGGALDPVVRSISPANGPTDGGTAVRIFGERFAAGASARLGASALDSMVVVSATEIDGITPAGAVGQADVIVVNPDTRVGTLRKGFTYLAPSSGPDIGFCNLQFPAEANVAVGEAFTLYGRVYALGVTDSAGQGAGVQMQAGLGFEDGGFGWADATYNTDVPSSPSATDLNNDEYQWSSVGPAPGSYATAFRARLGDGGWHFCELDGLHDAVDPSQLGQLTVAAAAPPSVSWCNLQFPTEQQAQPDAGLTVYGRVYQPGVTDLEGAGPGIAMQLGLTGGDGGWTWRSGSFHSDEDGLNAGDHANDEYEASFNVPAVGNYEMAYRASVDGGPWTFCEVDGPHADYAPLSAAPLVVGDTVAYCNLQFPQYPPDAQLPVGAPASFYGRVYQAGVTDSVGQGAGIELQFGYGPGDGGWSWFPSDFNGDRDGLNAGDNANDEYISGITTPPAGTYLTLFRARLDGGPWLHCEPDGPHLGIAPASAGQLVTQ